MTGGCGWRRVLWLAGVEKGAELALVSSTAFCMILDNLVSVSPFLRGAEGPQGSTAGCRTWTHRAESPMSD